MSRLYEITGDLLTLQEMLEDGVEDQALTDTLEAVQLEYADKLEACCKVVKNLEAIRDAKKSEAKRLTDSANTLDNSIDRLKKTMFDSMKATNTPKVQGQLFTVAIQRNGGKIPVNYDKSNDHITDNLPDQLVTVIEKPNLDAIRETLETGLTVEGFTLGERGESLRIK